MAMLQVRACKTRSDKLITHIWDSMIGSASALYVTFLLSSLDFVVNAMISPLMRLAALAAVSGVRRR